MTPADRSRRRSPVVPFVFMAVSLPLLIGLGVWQWRRLGEKEALIARIEARSHLPPQEVSLTELAGSGLDADQLDYTPVRLVGRFVDDREAFVFTNREEAAGGKPAGPGYDVLTPFAAEGGGVILVDRGFVPDTKLDPATRRAGAITGQTTISGLMRRPERRSILDVADQPDQNRFAVRDPRAILAAKLTGTAEGALRPFIDRVYLDLREPVPPGGLPSPNETVLSIPNNHLQYALTWWGLALVFGIMFAVFLRGSSKAA